MSVHSLRASNEAVSHRLVRGWSADSGEQVEGVRLILSSRTTSQDLH